MMRPREAKIMTDPADPILLADIQHPGLARLFDYWDKQRAGREMPARVDIDPLDMSFILGKVALVDVLHDPLRFRFRLHGSGMTQRAGYNLTGRFVDDIPDTEFREAARNGFTTVVTSRRPRYSRRDRVLDGKRLNYEALILPFSNDGERIDMLMAGLIYIDP
jgi:hypothetical protein